jgi:hypothetical protein
MCIVLTRQTDPMAHHESIMAIMAIMAGVAL